MSFNWIKTNIMQTIDTPLECSDWLITIFLPHLADFPTCCKYGLLLVVAHTHYYRLKNE